MTNRRTAVIGGGAAGFFCAICLKEMVAPMEVTIFERGHRVLQKVEISGGGRCNCTNTFFDVSDLAQVYPRGHRLLKRLFNGFGPKDAYEWFERHGVKLVVQDDQCVFPQSQDSHTIINMFLAKARSLGIEVKTGAGVASLEALADYDFVVVTTGGQPRSEGLEWLGHPIEQPVPSLFSFQIADKALQSLMGTVAGQATVFIPGTKLRASGPLLVTHWGMSGPAILRLSSHAARLLADNDYRLPLCVNWTGRGEEEVRAAIEAELSAHPKRTACSLRMDGIPARLLEYLVRKCLGIKAESRWADLSRKDMNRLVNQLCNDSYDIAGRTPFKDEYVTCGGISLTSVWPATLESRLRPHLFFAGEVLDIDGVTGGFNFQAAWTTAYTVAQAIARAAEAPSI